MVEKYYRLYENIKNQKCNNTPSDIVDKLNNALMVIYDRINHHQPLSALELLGEN